VEISGRNVDVSTLQPLAIPGLLDWQRSAPAEDLAQNAGRVR
jgi:hypothetical protein